MNDKALRQLSKAAYDATRRFGSTESRDAADILQVIDRLGYQVTPKQQLKEWNGVGWPPVGTECEISYCGRAFKYCKVKYVGAEVCVVDHNEKVEQNYQLQTVKFRPIPTEKEKLVEQALSNYGDFVANGDGDCAVSEESARMALELAYDAGMLKQPDSK